MNKTNHHIVSLYLIITQLGWLQWYQVCWYEFARTLYSTTIVLIHHSLNKKADILQTKLKRIFLNESVIFITILLRFVNDVSVESESVQVMACVQIGVNLLSEPMITQAHICKYQYSMLLTLVHGSSRSIYIGNQLPSGCNQWYLFTSLRPSVCITKNQWYRYFYAFLVARYEVHKWIANTEKNMKERAKPDFWQHYKNIPNDIHREALNTENVLLGAETIDVRT